MNNTNLDDLLRGSALRPISAQTVSPETINDLFEKVRLDVPRRRRRAALIALPSLY